MTLRRGRRSNVGIARSRPRYTWRMWDSALMISSALAVGINLSAEGSMVPFSGLGVFGDFTIRRIRGTLAVTSQSSVEGTVPQGLAWGIYVAELDAFTANALPEPVVDPVDWLGFGEVYASEHGIFAADVHVPTIVPIETKAMRKVNENHQAIVLVFQWLTSTDQTLSVVSSGRVLVSHGQR